MRVVGILALVTLLVFVGFQMKQSRDKATAEVTVAGRGRFLDGMLPNWLWAVADCARKRNEKRVLQPFVKRIAGDWSGTV